MYVWGGAGATILHRLNVLQNRAVRIITSSPYRASAGPIFKQLNILQLSDIRKFQLIIFMFKCKYNLLPDLCVIYCPSVNKPYHMRISSYYVIHAFRTNIREQSISVIGPKIWDTLPSNLINTNNLLYFKHQVHQYLIAFY